MEGRYSRSSIRYYVLFTAWIEILILFRARVPRFSNFTFLPFALGLVAFNYYVFDHNDRWKVYARRFEQYSLFKLNMGRLAVAGAVLLIIGGSMLCIQQYWRESGSLKTESHQQK